MLEVTITNNQIIGDCSGANAKIYVSAASSQHIQHAVVMGNMTQNAGATQDPYLVEVDYTNGGIFTSNEAYNDVTSGVVDNGIGNGYIYIGNNCSNVSCPGN